MTDTDLDEYFPWATREQRIAILVYHDFGWTIEPMSPDSDEIEIRRPTGEWIDRAAIHPNGQVTSL